MNATNVICKKVETIPEFIDAVRLRVDVFILEQRFQPGWEPDEDDKQSEHVIAVADGRIVCTARFRWTNPKEMKLERMVTAKEMRGRGIGRSLVSFVLNEMLELKPARIWLRSQVKTQGFYEKCGFVPCSPTFEMWGVAHIDMNLANNNG